MTLLFLSLSILSVSVRVRGRGHPSRFWVLENSRKKDILML